jgi:phosphatidate cytidylyltransferase
MTELQKRILSGAFLLLLLVGCYINAVLILPIALFCWVQVQKEAKLICGSKLSNYFYLWMISACVLGSAVLISTTYVWIALALASNVFVLNHLYKWPNVTLNDCTFLVWAGVFAPVFWLVSSGLDQVIFLQYLIAIAVVDTTAYFIGKQWGNHAICAKLSPKKTVEGWIGSIVCLCIFFVAILYPDVPLLVLLILAFVFASAVLAGDVFISSIKRQCQVKDTGSLIPGHGGVMDRLDGYVLVMPWLPLVYGLL